MGVTLQTGSALTLDKFWRWLREHTNCIIRAGTPDSYLYDFEDLHWHLDEDAERNFIVQIIRGKQLFAEMVINPRDVVVVQAIPEAEAGEGGEGHRFLFELIGGPKDESFALYHFLMAHGFDNEEHPTFKH